MTNRKRLAKMTVALTPGETVLAMLDAARDLRAALVDLHDETHGDPCPRVHCWVDDYLDGEQEN